MPNLIISGGRHWKPFIQAEYLLDRIVKEHDITCILNGGATGADAFARDYAKHRGIKCETFDADWTSALGKAAGPARNKAMALACDPSTDGVVLFRGGKGTASMKREALRAGLPIWYEEV